MRRAFARLQAGDVALLKALLLLRGRRAELLDQAPRRLQLLRASRKRTERGQAWTLGRQRLRFRLLLLRPPLCERACYRQGPQRSPGAGSQLMPARACGPALEALHPHLHGRRLPGAHALVRSRQQQQPVEVRALPGAGLQRPQRQRGQLAPDQAGLHVEGANDGPPLEQVRMVAHLARKQGAVS